MAPTRPRGGVVGAFHIKGAPGAFASFPALRTIRVRHTTPALSFDRIHALLPLLNSRHCSCAHRCCDSNQLQSDLQVTRSHKYTDRDHAGIADGTAEREARLPKYFAKSGHADTDPTKTKKGGSGKGNWGAMGDEVEDIRPNMANARRRSNSSTHNLKDFKTKFETIETEPVFEESIHGPMGEELEKQSTTSTENSIAEEDHGKKF
ncbi:hypothetical protein GGP41_009480 [Bipolaris sorokiniana]|uniref:Hyaluronan/mRNA-binding protein domain-containing protein n=1 Tax=Cochliobolus sativus TaxID=45130 RepID=A0A8H6DRQ6_COCSA|nr:hypothetical protein GGP41_009480 [Bipolaris sorokiniana]